MNIYDESMQAHLNLRGKLKIEPKVQIDSPKNLSTYYTPGVGAVSKYLAAHPDKTPLFTGTNNSVAIISDGSAVLGLGNIGPEGALPVMEGKAMIFKQFANIDGFPIVLNTQDPQKIVDTIIAIAPSFGAINLEDFAAPHCFFVESELKKHLKMPIMHDDQHGTAIVVLAGLINACRLTNRDLSKAKIVLAGAGAAGVAVAKLLYDFAKPKITVVDSKGIITKSRGDLNLEKQLLLNYGVNDQQDGNLADALLDADIFIGVSRGGLLSSSMIKSMAKKPIIFALANPEPEIYPNEALKAGAAIVATGRSDFDNQVNNALAFPGVFRGALDYHTTIDDHHKLKAAMAIADIIDKPKVNLIIPSIFNPKVVPAVSAVFKN